MIVATPLDLPVIEPDNWAVFWDIWNNHSGNLVKTSINVVNNAEVGATDIWKGLDIYSKGNFRTSWTAPLVDIKTSLPKLYEMCNTLPIKNVFRVRLISSLCDFESHTDDNADTWSIRAYFHYTDTRDQWYLTKPNDINGHRYYLHIPQGTNWFSYNDKFCWHGTDYNPQHPKILLQVFSFGGNDELIASSIEKYKDYTITL